MLFAVYLCGLASLGLAVAVIAVVTWAEGAIKTLDGAVVFLLGVAGGVLPVSAFLFATIWIDLYRWISGGVR